MPKRQTQRIIDSRRRNSSATIIGATGSGVPVSLTAGDGLVLTGTTLDVVAGDGVSVAADSVAVDSTVVRTTRTVTAGSGLTGGGALSADLTLNVGAGTLVTVGADTVGITAGSSYQFIGTGSGTAAAWQNLSGLAGNGLTHSNGVLAVGVSGLGLSVGADAVALASSSNPTEAAILASNASGYLQLVRIGLGMAPTKPLSVSGDAGISGNVAAGSLSVTGAATVGQDFTVGANVLYVNQAGTRVGINRTPDQQFDLDVAGAIRGQYLIGKHAVQLTAAIGVWHYDGSAPYELDYSGSNASHMGIAGTEAGGLIFRPGKYGKAAQFAGAITNIILNPSFETNTTNWTAQLGATLAQYAGAAYVGAYSLRITHVASTTSGASTLYTTSTQGTYTASCYLKAYAAADVGLNCSLLMRFTYSDATTSDVSVNHTLTTAWTRVQVTATTNGAKTLSNITVFVRDLLSGAAHDSLVDAVQLENASFAGAYLDGSLGSGHSWSGTAHASTSSRTVAQLTYSTSGVSASAGTVMAWVYLDRSAGTQTVLRVTGSTAGNIYLLISSGNLAGYWGTAEVTGTAISALAWHHVAMTYSGTTLTLYIDGVAVASGTSSGFSGMPTTMSVGGQAGSSVLHGLLDELVLTDYAADAKLIRAIYESDAPVFVESSVFHWRAPSRVPIWVDEFGLWARGVSGNEILGLYGGDPRNPTGGVTKSWGGVTMSENDIVIGRASGGYVFWDDSAQTMNLKGAMVVDGNSYFNGVVTIATGGELRQGTGTLGSNYTGLRIWRDGDVGRIGGYASNTLQWYAGTDGVLYAGAGRVVLDGTGIAVQASSGTEATAQYAYRILESGANDGFEGGLYAYEGPSNVGQYIQLRAYNPGNPACISLLAECGSNNAATIELIAKYSTTQSRIQLSKSGDIEIDGMTYFDSPLTLDEVASTPANPSSSNRARIYVRNDNLIIQWNDGGTIRYKYLALSGTGTTWTHTTTAP